jgi:hypothetical protein
MKLTIPAEPAASIIKKLGGEMVVSRVTGTKRVAPYRWCYSRERGGTGGLIPQRHHRKILEYARENGIPLTSDEFLPPLTASPDDTEAKVLATAPEQAGAA